MGKTNEQTSGNAASAPETPNAPACPCETCKANKETNIAKAICSLRRKMFLLNCFFHFTRNNPRNREYCYHVLIAAVGYDEWMKVDSSLRLRWESAQNSFDRLYGLIKAFSDGKAHIVSLLVPSVSDSKNDCDKNDLQKLSDQMNDLKKTLDRVDKSMHVLRNLEVSAVILSKAKELVQAYENADMQS